MRAAALLIILAGAASALILAFDAEGNLYVSTGDNTNPHATGYAPIDERPGRGPWDAQKSSSNTNDLRGKILRITPQADGSYEYTAPPVLSFDKAPAVQVYVEKDGVAWIGNGEELIRYDPRMPGRYDVPFAVLIRQIESRTTGQVLFGGWPLGEGERLTIDPLHRSLNVQVAAASYNAPDQNEYQYWLEINFCISCK